MILILFGDCKASPCTPLKCKPFVHISHRNFCRRSYISGFQKKKLIEKSSKMTKIFWLFSSMNFKKSTKITFFCRVATYTYHVMLKFVPENCLGVKEEFSYHDSYKKCIQNFFGSNMTSRRGKKSFF